MAIRLIADTIHYVSADKFQSDIIRVNPGDFTRIFAIELSIHTNIAGNTNGEPGWPAGSTHQCAAKRDVLDLGRVIFIIQLQ
jgi:hypothetical protein